MSNCLVAVKKVINPYTRIQVKSDLSGIDQTDLRFVINPFDNNALEQAVNCKQQQAIHSITAISIGTECQDILRQALAKGADQAIWIKTDLELTPLNTAKILRYISQQQSFNLIFLGKQAVDDDCNQTSQMLAALLDWPQSCFTTEVIFNTPHSISIQRELDSGIITETIELPAVVSWELSATEPQKISLPQLMQAKKKPLTIIELNTLPIYEQLNFNQLLIKKITNPPSKSCGVKISTVKELVHQLFTKEQIFGD